MRKLFYITFILLSISTISTHTNASEKLVIIAPQESAFVALNYRGQPSLAIEGWACGTSGARAALRTADYMYHLKFAEQAFKSASAGLQANYENRKKTVKPPVVFSGFSREEVYASIASSIARFSVNIETINSDFELIKKDLEFALKDKPENFFSVNFNERTLEENHLDDSLRIASWQDNGAYRVWTVTDCYTFSELNAMQRAINEALNVASAARDEFFRTVTRVHNGHGQPFTIK